jgi:hypothetical protein
MMCSGPDRIPFGQLDAALQQQKVELTNLPGKMQLEKKTRLWEQK